MRCRKARWYLSARCDDTLSERQRQAILLCHGYDWTLAEVAELWGTQRSTVQRQIDRGMARLRKRLGVSDA